MAMTDDSPLINNIQDGSVRSRYGSRANNDSLYYSSYVFDLTKSLSQSYTGKKYDPLAAPPSAKRNLGWIGGVFAAVALAQFSTNLFFACRLVIRVLSLKVRVYMSSASSPVSVRMFISVGTGSKRGTNLSLPAAFRSTKHASNARAFAPPSWKRKI